MGPISFPPMTPREASCPSIWGMSPFEVHDRFWRSIGVEVVRPGHYKAFASHVPTFLLLDERTLAVFPLDQVRLRRHGSVRLRLNAPNEHECEEIIVSDAGNRFIRFERVYRSAVVRGISAIVTRDRELADRWRNTKTTEQADEIFDFRFKPRPQTLTTGGFFDGRRSAEQLQFLEYLAQVWLFPDIAFPELREVKPACLDPSAESDFLGYAVFWTDMDRWRSPTQSGNAYLGSRDPLGRPNL